MSTGAEEPSAELLWTSSVQRLHALSCQVACHYRALSAPVLIAVTSQRVYEVASQYKMVF